MTASGTGGVTPQVHRLVSGIDYPMFIVTVAADGRRAGCLVGFTTQCSIDPPRFLVCISVANHTFGVARAARVMVMHLVPDDAAGLAELFGSRTGDEVDKFARCEWTPGPEGTPVLAGCPNWFAGRLLRRVPAGDHWAFLLDPFAAESGPDVDAFTFHRARRMEPGHPARAADQPRSVARTAAGAGSRRERRGPTNIAETAATSAPAAPIQNASTKPDSAGTPPVPATLLAARSTAPT
jgi:flavin reductase (DIM6/NTAB) family NADH-FMN oxidoreductase RutF